MCIDSHENIILYTHRLQLVEANDREKGTINKDKYTQVDFPVWRPRRQPEGRKATRQPQNFGTENFTAVRFGLQPPARNFGPFAYVARQPQNFGTENFTPVRFGLQPPARNFGPFAHVARQPQNFGTESVAAARFSLQPPEVNVGPAINVQPWQPPISFNQFASYVHNFPQV